MKIILMQLIAVSWITTMAAAQSQYRSPFAIAADAAGNKLYIAEHTAKQIGVFDLSEKKRVGVYSLAQKPNGLCLSPDGLYLYAACGNEKGGVYVINTETGAIENTLSGGHTPTSPVVSREGNRLYVCNRYNNNVSLFDLNTQKKMSNIAVLREPVAAALLPDGKYLFIANLLPVNSLNRGYPTAAVSVIDTAAQKKISDIPLPNGSTSLRGICTSADGEYVYVTHILARYQYPTTQLERGWVNTNALSIIDAANKTCVNTVLLDDLDSGAANPWGVTCTEDGKYLCVTHAGTHEISIIDRPKLHRKIAKVAAGEKGTDASVTPEDVPNDLSFIAAIRRRIKLTGKGPRSIVVVGKTAYMAEYFSDSLGVADITDGSYSKPFSINLSDDKKTPDVKPANPGEIEVIRRKGEALFNDATICFQSWQSCASCHPDARADGLNWDLLNDGVGNPRNTKSLVYSHRTPPVMITGIRKKAEDAVRAGIKYILFSNRPESEAVAIDEYLKSLECLPSPYLVEDSSTGSFVLSQAAQNGKKIFDNAGCSLCHSGAMFTDMKSYNVENAHEIQQDKLFDTPTLIEIWQTAPYLNDGRAASIKETLTEFNENDKHGKISGLTQIEIAELTEYVLSL